MKTCAGVVLLAACAVAITRDQFYPNGPGLDQKLPKGHEIPSPEAFLTVPVVFYGETYDTVFVNNFGVLSFRADIPSFINTEFPLPYPSIAAFYTNIDTTEEGAVYYRETNEPHIISKAEESVQNNFHDYYDFVPTSVFIATWLEVPYTSDVRHLKNSFQIAIISNGTESFVELLYPEREIQWIEKETRPESQPDAKAQAGFVAEDGRLFTLRGSGSHQIRNIISWTNTHEPGKYVYRVGNIPVDGNIENPDQYNQSEVEIEEESKTCALSGPSVCHMEARCVDYQTGICCQCNEGFYGNGKSCIKTDVPLRVHGKLNGILNDIHLNDVNIQAYVMVADARAYTALALAPPVLGRSLMLLNVLGGIVGWLFAKPSGNAKNGYQLTGAVFNHSAEIWFPDTNDRVMIHQEYVGHDVFDQIIIESDVRGTVPVIESGEKLELSEYDEQYTIVEPGLVRSEAKRILTNKKTGKKYDLRISQIISYVPCLHAPTSPESTLPFNLKVSKNYLGYEPGKDNIVRYSTSNKIVPIGQEDPCARGQDTCDVHSVCVVQGDSFTCVCKSGYTNTWTLDGASGCADIDECSAGTHNCDTNAICYNHDGGFQCRCTEGFDGDGITCTPRSRCNDIKCGDNAQCFESPEGPVCNCAPGYTGDGSSCWEIRELPCARCSVNAFCQETYCECLPGYTGDGYQCEWIGYTTTSEPPAYSYQEYTSPPVAYSQEASPYPEQESHYYVSEEPYGSETTPVPETPPYFSETPDFPDTSSNAPAKEAEYNETFVLPSCDSQNCLCPPGYSNYRDQSNNELCRIESYSAPKQNNGDGDSSIGCEVDNDCPPNAVCTFTADEDNARTGRCVCPEGYEGDGYQCLERTGPSCSCGLNAHCIESVVPDELICVCDGGYVGDGYHCRPSFSCTNNSDCEYHAECRPNTITNELICQCIEGYVKDQSDACIPDGPLCNGVLCAEHASCLYDENLKLNYCYCDDGYEGDSIFQCVPAGRTCDATHDCHYDAVCTPIDNSYQCVCRDGYVGDGYSCIQELSCRTDSYLCSAQASCLKQGDAYVCECNSGYSGNGSHCVLNPRLSGNFLVLSEGATIYRVPFQMTPKDYATPISSSIDQIAVGVDVDCVAGRIYWGDVVGNTIRRVSYDGSGFESFLRKGVISPEGISVDWSARNIFWTDSRKLTVEVANLETKVRKVLFAVEGIFNPRGIVAHPRRGKIFWSDWKRRDPKIEWANMDGSQRGVFLNKDDVTLPNSLAIDWERERLCYADAALLSIKCVGIDSMEREVIAASCSYPFSLAINGNQFYWTDWKTLKIETVDVSSKLRSQLPMVVSSRPYGLAVAPGQCPAVNNMCSQHNGRCAHNQLCLPNGQGRTCVDGDDTYSEL